MNEYIAPPSVWEELELNKVWLNRRRKIALLRFFEIDEKAKRKYIRNFAILVGNEIVTSCIEETMQFMEELFLFEKGNVQNEFLTVVRKDNKITNLKVNKISEENENSYISISAARAMYRMINLTMQGYSMARALDYDYVLTPEILIDYLDEIEESA